MNREIAETFMFGFKNYQWQQHPLLFKHVELGIKIIYDDFESRTCENCKFYFIHMQYGQGMQCKNHDSDMHQVKITSKDFGCNKWETK